jgi:hypothetical protein
VLIVAPVALLVLALVAFILAFVRASLTFDYVSMAASALSFALVAVLTRVGRTSRVTKLGPPAAPLPVSNASGALATETDLAQTDFAQPNEEAGAGGGSQWVPGEQGAELAGVAGDPRTLPDPLAGPDADVDGSGEGRFPIADYEDLNSDEILPPLPLPHPDGIEVGREGEKGGRGRKAILDRLDELEASAGAQGEVVEPGKQEQASSEAGLPGGPGGEPGRPVAFVEHQPEDEEVPRDEAAWEEEDSWLEALANGAGGSAGETSWDDDQPWEDEADWEAEFPIADYDELRAAEVVALLEVLDPDELDLVRARELAGGRRPPILNRIDSLLTPSRPDGGGGVAGRPGDGDGRAGAA